MTFGTWSLISFSATYGMLHDIDHTVVHNATSSQKVAIVMSQICFIKASTFDRICIIVHYYIWVQFSVEYLTDDDDMNLCICIWKFRDGEICGIVRALVYTQENV